MSKKEEAIRIIIFFMVMYFALIGVDILVYERYVKNYSVLNATYEQIKEKETMEFIVFSIKIGILVVASALCFKVRFPKGKNKKT